MSKSNHLSLGEFLRSEREKRGVTLEQVASATKISVRQLQLLEEDRYSELPAKPFIRGFINSYSRFIEIDPKEVLIQYNDFLNKKSHERPKRDAGHSGYVFERKEGEQSKKMLWLILGGFAVLGAIAFFIVKPNMKRHRKSHLERLKNAAVTPGVTGEISGAPTPGPSGSLVATGTASGTPAPSAALSPAPSPTSAGPSPTTVPSPTPVPSPTAAAPTAKPTPQPSPAPTAAPNPSTTPAPTDPNRKPDRLNSGADLLLSEVKEKVLITAGSDTWIRFKVDEKPQNLIILRSGNKLMLRAKEKILYQISHPAGAKLNISGKITDISTDTVEPLSGVQPAKLKKEIPTPFASDKPIPKTVPPPRGGASASPTPTP